MAWSQNSIGRHSQPRLDLGEKECELEYDAVPQAGPSSVRTTRKPFRSYRAPHTVRHSSTSRVSASPEPDQEVLAFIQAQQSSILSTSEARQAEQLKMERFQHGASKVKSRHQREKEEAERKKKQEELDAAQAYSDFIAAMGSSNDDNIRSTPRASGFVGAGGKAYVGSRQATNANASDTSIKRSNAFGDDNGNTEDLEDEDGLSALRKDPAVKRKRATMDSFLSEIQTEQAERESRLSAIASSSGTSISTLLAQEGIKPGSRDTSANVRTTNICVLNLPSGVSEASVAEFFAEWGDVATVKIMWPRGDARDRATGLTGFVAYMTRNDAERAFQQCDGALWGNSRLKLSWGKNMMLPARPMHSKPNSSKQQDPRDVSNEARGSMQTSLPSIVIRHRRPRRPNVVIDTLKQQVEEYQDAAGDSVSQPELRRLFIETVASQVRFHGLGFETHLQAKEAGNPKFAFLNEPQSAAYQYFRLCVDPSYEVEVPATPFVDQGDDDGDYYSTDSGEESETRRQGKGVRRSGPTLGALARARLHSMLRHLTLRRERIGRVMAFAMDHAAAHLEITDILVSSIVQPLTPMPRKFARLYCLSDLLHNSGMPVPNAWKYRGALEAQLPLVFGHLSQIIHTFPGRMKQEAIKAQLVALLQVWESWLVVSPPIMLRLRQLVDAPKKLLSLTKHAPQTGETKDGEGIVHSDEDLDGEAM